MPSDQLLTPLPFPLKVYFGFSHCPDICPDELDKMSRMIDLINGPPTASTSPIPPPPQPPSPTDPTSSSSSSTVSTSSPPTPQPARPPLLPIFISCDPARDTPAVLTSYLREFHPSLVGLTGTWQQVKDVCRAYRVYFSTPEGVKPGQDYLVDHSIYFYLMGEFLRVCAILPPKPRNIRKCRQHVQFFANDNMTKKTDPDGDFVECLGRQHTPESAAKIIKEHMSDWRNGVKVH